jgi:hypothetical protein
LRIVFVLLTYTKTIIIFLLMKWKEELPENCPPPEAVSPNGVFFRLYDPNDYPSTFFSHRRLFPLKDFNASECIARAISVYDTEASCAEITKYPAQRNKRVLPVNLRPEDGLIQKTGKSPNHFSWWMEQSFEPPHLNT